MIPLWFFTLACVAILVSSVAFARGSFRFGKRCALREKGYLIQAGIEYLTVLREAERGAAPGTQLQLELVVYRATTPSYQGRMKLPNRVVGTAEIMLNASP